MTTKHKFAFPGDFIINEIFKEYGSKDFYKKFKAGEYQFGPDITKEWHSVYMNGVGICHQEEFFNFIDKLKKKFVKEFPEKAIQYEVIVAHILPIAAPLFFEQDTTPING